MFCPNYKYLKTNGTTLYVFPGVAEDKNFETQNDNYKMYLSHYVLVNFPRQNDNVFDIENTFEQNATSIVPSTFKDQLVESLRNYVANHESTIRNSKLNSSTYYYDVLEPYTTTEKIFWKWAKSLNLLAYEPADNVNEYLGSDSKYNQTGPTGNTTYFKEYLWKERNINTYDATNIIFGDSGETIDPIYTPINPITIQLTASTNYKPGDYILINKKELDSPFYVDPTTGNASLIQSKLQIIHVFTTTTLNDTIIVDTASGILVSDFGLVSDRNMYLVYNRFVQFISEIAGINNVQLSDKAYSETYANISYQHGQIPYTLWNIKDDNNYKPNSRYPILDSEIQTEIQGGENANNPILVNPSLYPGDIWAQYDAANFTYTTQSGDLNRRYGNYYGNFSLSNASPTLAYPDFNGSTIDGLTLNLNISDYAKAVSYLYPIESFTEFCATSFNNIAPSDFEFNAILWYYTIEDVTGNNIDIATNLYGVQFLDTPSNDIDFAKTKIPSIKKLVSNGYQDGNAYSFKLDTNIVIDSDSPVPSFDPDKIYSLFGMELYYEAMTRITYFNDQLNNFIVSSSNLSQQVSNLSGLIYTQTSIDSITSRMNNLENLLNVFSTLQIGPSDTIIPYLDTTVNPAMLRLNSIDKQYGYIYHYNTTDMFVESVNNNSLTKISKIAKTIPVVNGKDFLVSINNNDNHTNVSPAYDTTIIQDKLKITLDKDLEFKQKMDIIVIPKLNDTILLLNDPKEPINDKKLELFINYNDDTQIVEQKLMELSLPVLKFNSGSGYLNETHVGLDDISEFKVKNVYYSKPSTSKRTFSFIVEDDLKNKSTLVNSVDFVQRLSRMYINNFIIQENPTLTNIGNYVNFSSQYQVSENVSYVRSEIFDVELVSKGSGYNGSAAGTITVTGLVYGSGTFDVSITTNNSGEIISIELLNYTGLTTPDLATTPITITGTGTLGTCKLIVKAVTKVKVSMDYNLDADLNQILSFYDTKTSIATLTSNNEVNISRYFKCLPTLTFLRGYKISITRISDVKNTSFQNIDQRYKVIVDKL